MLTILAFLFVIGIIIFIHELGHFLVAKWTGVRVERFSLGFGKKIWGFKWGETSYQISWLPLGGYVKMSGEGGEEFLIADEVDSSAREAGFQPGDKILRIEGSLVSASKWYEMESGASKDPNKKLTFLIERDERKIEVKVAPKFIEGMKVFSERDDPRSFSKQPPGNKLKIVVAGPFMNLLLPFLLLPAVFMLGVKIPAYLEESPIIGYVEAESPAQEAGFQKGDKILQINGEKVETWREANVIFQSNPGVKLSVEIERKGEIKELKIKPAPSEEGLRVITGVGEEIGPFIGNVKAGGPAEEAGLKAGDKVISIEGISVSDWYEMASTIKKNPDKELTLLVERERKNFEVRVKPERMEQGSDKGYIGIFPKRDETLKKYGFFEAIGEGIKEAAVLVVDVTVLLCFTSTIYGFYQRKYWAYKPFPHTHTRRWACSIYDYREYKATPLKPKNPAENSANRDCFPDSSYGACCV